MTDFLDRAIARARGTERVLQPTLGSRYAPPTRDLVQPAVPGSLEAPIFQEVIAGGRPAARVGTPSVSRPPAVTGGSAAGAPQPASKIESLLTPPVTGAPALATFAIDVPPIQVPVATHEPRSEVGDGVAVASPPGRFDATSSSAPLVSRSDAEAADGRMRGAARRSPAAAAVDAAAEDARALRPQSGHEDHEASRGEHAAKKDGKKDGKKKDGNRTGDTGVPKDGRSGEQDDDSFWHKLFGASDLAPPRDTAPTTPGGERASADDGRAEPRGVEVRVDRLDIRAPAAPPAPRLVERGRRGPRLGLQEYLRRYGAGRGQSR